MWNDDASDNAMAVDAISDRLAAVTALAEGLDASLCGGRGNTRRILDGTASGAPEEWYSSLRTAGRPQDQSDDEFVTASECTCTPSRSSSFHTASEGGAASPWWEVDARTSDGEPGLQTITTVTEESGIIMHEVTETTHLKLSHSSTMDVTSFLLTRDVVESGGSAEEAREEAASVADTDSTPRSHDGEEPQSPDDRSESHLTDDPRQLLSSLKEVGSSPHDADLTGARYYYHQYITRHGVKGIL